MVPQLRGMTYVKRLTFLNLPSLYYRCKHMDMIVTYKIIQGRNAESSLFLIWEAQDQMDSNYIKNTLELIQNFITSRIG